MSSILIVGIIASFGLICGEIATKLRLPKVTGYIIAGVLLNPSLSDFIPKNFTSHTDLVTNVALSFITFSVGGTLLYSRIKKLGKGIIYITLCEGEFAFIIVIVGILAGGALLIQTADATWVSTFIPISLLMGCLAAPTDPSATLAITHQYKAKGSVTSTIMGVAAFDDVLGIVNYSLAIVLAQALIMHEKFSIFSSLLKPAVAILGAVFLGIAFGFIFNLSTKFLKKETEGALIVVVFALLSLCFGIATILDADELLSTMIMGIVVVNYNPNREKIFKILERYTEELIFILFFVLSGMQLNFSILSSHILLVLFFVILRSIGKVSGAITGAVLAKSSSKVKKYTAGGLIPQGGIVVGLALLIKQNQAFAGISDIILSVIIGATIFHELIGPILSKMAIKKAGEITTT
jgi:Kef-type K+ transport system membrane component KefB